MLTVATSTERLKPCIALNNNNAYCFNMPQAHVNFGDQICIFIRVYFYHVNYTFNFKELI